MDAFGWLVALTLRCTVVLSVALGLGLFLRRSSAAARHRLLTLTAVSLVALPVLPWVLPSLELPLVLPGLERSSSAPVVASATPAETIGVSGEESRPKPGLAGAHAAAWDTATRPRGVDYRAAFSVAAVVAWLIGVVAALVRLGQALRCERRLLAAARPLEGPWLETLGEARRMLAMTRPVRLLASDAIETPLTCGWPRPAVFLPPIAERWSEDRRRLVVQHELVHVVHGDGLRRLAWRLVAALYWFHPLARIAERQAGLVGEQACDEAVVRLGTRPSLYARHLLEIAEALRGRPARFASALPMVERNQFERRLVMILESNPVSSCGRGVALACLAFLAATVLGVACAALARPQHGSATVGQPQASISAQTSDGAPCLDGFSSTTLDGDYSSYQHDLGNGRRLCARIVGPVRFDERTGAIREIPHGSSVLIETRELQKNSQRMLITEEQGAPRYEWWLNGSARPVDDDARAWLGEALAAISAFRAIGEIQGHVGSLQGEIGSIQGRIGSLQGRIGAIQGEEGSLQGKIGAIQGEQGSLQGEIGSHQGAIGSLQAARAVASDDLRKGIDRDIRAHEAAIKKLEAEKDDGALARRLAEAEAELRAFQQSSRGKIDDLERQIDAIRSENKIGELEKEIDSLHADERIDEIRRRAAPSLDRLKALIGKLGS